MKPKKILVLNHYGELVKDPRPWTLEAWRRETELAKELNLLRPRGPKLMVRVVE